MSPPWAQGSVSEPEGSGSEPSSMDRRALCLSPPSSGTEGALSLSSIEGALSFSSMDRRTLCLSPPSSGKARSLLHGVQGRGPDPFIRSTLQWIEKRPWPPIAPHPYESVPASRFLRVCSVGPAPAPQCACIPSALEAYCSLLFSSSPPSPRTLTLHPVGLEPSPYPSLPQGGVGKGGRQQTDRGAQAWRPRATG